MERLSGITTPEMGRNTPCWNYTFLHLSVLNLDVTEILIQESFRVNHAVSHNRIHIQGIKAFLTFLVKQLPTPVLDQDSQRYRKRFNVTFANYILTQPINFIPDFFRLSVCFHVYKILDFFLTSILNFSVQ